MNNSIYELAVKMLNLHVEDEEMKEDIKSYLIKKNMKDSNLANY
ncbi:hypothetical protein [Priestia megaterium]|nr:hypothetical protein [Priestia megaterium]